MNKQNKKEDGSDIGGIVCGGCTLIGVGIGWFTNKNVIMSGFIGTGIGLLAMAAIMAYYKRTKNGL
jgi:hypothetical protein